MRASLVSAALCSSLVLSGCSAFSGLNSSSKVVSGSGTGAAIHGIVHGGQNPVKNSHVHLMAVGNTGYGGNAISLLTTGAGQDSIGYYVLSAADGSFTVTGDYTCPQTGGSPVTYLLATQGDSGSGNNTAIALLTPLGDCTQAGYASQSVVVNEVSTVGTTYIARGIITSLTQVSLPATPLAQTELKNLYTDLLFINGVAQATTPAGNGTAPQAEINTLANILAACVNSTGPSSTACSTLFNNAPSTGASPVIPQETATAIFNIATNPGANVANLYALQVAGAPFQPSLSSAPNDFTVAITYTANPALNTPAGVAVDSSGNVWVANAGNASITEFGTDGSYQTTVSNGGLLEPTHIAIDGSGNLWVSNSASGTNTISEFNSTGTAITGSPFSGGGLNTPEGLAVDAQGHLWVANSGANVLSEFNVSNGSPVSSTGYTTASLSTATEVAVDDNGLVWITNSGNNTVSLWNPGTSTSYTGSPFSGGGLASPRSIGIDSNNNAWIVDRGGNLISEFANTGALSASGYTGGGLKGPLTVAIDPSNHVWAVNRSNNTISEFAPNGTAISPSTGFYGAGSTTPILNTPQGIAIDLNGNVWVASTNNNNLVEYVGAATPLVTPIAANIITGHGYGDSPVNKP